MIVFWTGNGIYAFIIILASVTFSLVGGLELSETLPSRFSPFVIIYAIVVGWVTAGILCLKLGRKWHREAVFGQYHTLYSIRVEHWGIFSLVIAGLMGILPVAALIVSILWHR